jgi:hypothetical protein
LLLAVSGLIVFVILPVIFNRQFRQLFLRKFESDFNDDYFLINIGNNNTGDLKTSYRYLYTDVVSGSVTSTSGKTSTLRLFFSNGRKYQCTFIDESKDAEANYENNVAFSFIKKLIRINENIVLRPSFYASKGGTVAIIILTIIAIVAFTMQIILVPKSLPFSLFAALFLYIQIIVRRKRDRETYQEYIDKIKREE